MVYIVICHLNYHWDASHATVQCWIIQTYVNLDDLSSSVILMNIGEHALKAGLDGKFVLTETTPHRWGKGSMMLTMRGVILGTTKAGKRVGSG